MTCCLFKARTRHLAHLSVCPNHLDRSPLPRDRGSLWYPGLRLQLLFEGPDHAILARTATPGWEGAQSLKKAGGGSGQPLPDPPHDCYAHFFGAEEFDIFSDFVAFKVKCAQNIDQKIGRAQNAVKKNKRGRSTKLKYIK